MDFDKLKELMNPDTQDDDEKKAKKNPFEGNISYRNDNGRLLKDSNFIRLSTVDVNAAIEIAKRPENLPQSINDDTENVDYKYIKLSNFTSREVTYRKRKAYLLTVTDGFWQGRVKDTNGNSHESSGRFTMDNDINCLIYKDNGEYEYVDKNKIWNFRISDIKVF